MNKTGLLLVAGICLIQFCLTSTMANSTNEQAEPKRHMVSIYHVAPGKHAGFLEWMAQQEALANKAGASATDWYVHQDGASWDFVAITEVPEAAVEAELGKKIDALAVEAGLPTGFARGIQFRQFISSHTDTYAMGPFTAAGMLKEAGLGAR